MRATAALPLLLVWVLASGSAKAAPEEYAVSLSASATSLSVNHVPALGGTQFSVYLWLTCGMYGSWYLEGMSVLEAVVVTDYTVTAFEPLNGAVSAGSPQHVQLGVGGCPMAPVLLGRWTVENTAQIPSGSFCLSAPGGQAPSCWVVACVGPPDVDVAGVTGFSVGDSTSCAADNGCVAPTALEGWSWGRTKAAFRDAAGD